jgi:hypothetical protein
MAGRLLARPRGARAAGRLWVGALQRGKRPPQAGRGVGERGFLRKASEHPDNGYLLGTR